MSFILNFRNTPKPSPETILKMSQGGGSGYRIYVFEESTRRCAINHKGQGHKEVIYLRVADVSCT